MQRTLSSGDSQVFLKQGQVPFKAQVEITSRFSGDRPRAREGLLEGLGVVREGLLEGLGVERGRRVVRLGIYKATLQRCVSWVVMSWESQISGGAFICLREGESPSRHWFLIDIIVVKRGSCGEGGLPTYQEHTTLSASLKSPCSITLLPQAPGDLLGSWTEVCADMSLQL